MTSRFENRLKQFREQIGQRQFDYTGMRIGGAVEDLQHVVALDDSCREGHVRNESVLLKVRSRN